MFQNLNFSLIECGTELSHKRAEIVKNLIVKNGGNFIDKKESNIKLLFYIYNLILLIVDCDNPPDFIISSKNLKVKQLTELYKNKPEVIGTELINVLSERIYSVELITNSVKEKVFLDKQYFKIDIFTGNNNFKRRNESENLTGEDVVDLFNKSKRGKNIVHTIMEREEEINKETIKSRVTVISQSNIVISSNSNSERKKSFKGGNNRIFELINSQDGGESSNNINLVPDNNQNKQKTNNEIFKEIQDNIVNLKKLGKEDQIFSEDEGEDDNENQEEELSQQNNINIITQSHTDNNLNNNNSNNIYTQSSDTQTIYSLSNFNFSQGEVSSSNFSSGKKSLKSFSSFQPDKAKFAFNAGTSQTNLNSHITSELEKVLEYHTNENNVFESLAYRKAIAQIKNASEKITSCDQLRNFKYLGKSIGNKIKEIILTGKLKKGDYLTNDNRNKTLKLLTSVWGIGMGQANKLYRKGIRTIEDLRKNQNLLTQNQKVGLQYYEEIQLRIPRKEIEDIFIVIKEELFKILPEDRLMIEVCGSYRRGKPTCGDIDIIITRTDDDGIDGILQTLVNSLMQRDLISEILALNGYAQRYQFMGVCKYESNPNRRIDIKVYRKVHFPFAILYFTGSAYFNRSMRLFATKLGYQLSDLHLKHRVGEKAGQFVDCETERDIFAALGLEYKSPQERDI